MRPQGVTTTPPVLPLSCVNRYDVDDLHPTIAIMVEVLRQKEREGKKNKDIDNKQMGMSPLDPSDVLIP